MRVDRRWWRSVEEGGEAKVEGKGVMALAVVVAAQGRRRRLEGGGRGGD